MVVTGKYTDLRYQSGDAQNGVVSISIDRGYEVGSGTGTLLWNGQAILTAAHVVGSHAKTITITTETESGKRSYQASNWLVHPEYDSVNVTNDLAIIWLGSSVNPDVVRSDLYRDSDEIGHQFSMVGYGDVGNGATGKVANINQLRLMADNTFDVSGEGLMGSPYIRLNWTPINTLFADFDNGLSANDAFGRLIYEADTGLGENEGLIASGDSGGPAFIGTKIAGVASYNAALRKSTINPDIDSNPLNSSFGEVAAWQRVSSFQEWIDQSMRANYLNAPTKPSEVVSTVSEGNSGTTYIYFMVEFNGLRDMNSIVSVDYETRDGSAIAGLDYLAISGTLNIYSNEDWALIPVEIIGDNFAEPDETFSLAIFNPVGGTFGGPIELVATRTILNDDGLL